jgi:hypothetical protein
MSSARRGYWFSAADNPGSMSRIDEGTASTIDIRLTALSVGPEATE